MINHIHLIMIKLYMINHIQLIMIKLYMINHTQLIVITCKLKNETWFELCVPCGIVTSVETHPATESDRILTTQMEKTFPEFGQGAVTIRKLDRCEK